MSKQELDDVSLVGIVKQMTAGKHRPIPDEVANIVYSFDENKKLNTEDRNAIIRFIYRSNVKVREVSMKDMISDICIKIGYNRRYDNPTVSKKDLEAIHAWVMDPDRK